jgi:hypothetical protein
MSSQAVQKKLEEARFYLSELARVDGVVSGGNERFDRYWSAFLSATRSVTYAIGDKLLYDSLRDSLTFEERSLLDSMINLRGKEVHGGVVTYLRRVEEIPVSNVYQDASCRIEVAAPPGPAAVIRKPRRFVALDDKHEEDVISVGQRYLSVLATLAERLEERLGSPTDPDPGTR